MKIKILDSYHDADEWLNLLRKMPEMLQDIYFMPGYIKLHLHESGSKGLLFFAQDGNDIWIYPFILRQILNIEEHRFDETIYDIETVYGYGGPITNSHDEKFINSANKSFVQWCKDNDVIAEFVRFHPIIQNQRFFSSQMNILNDRDTVSIDLSTLNESGLNVDQKTRNICRRAEKLGVQILDHSSCQDFNKFIDLYLSAMKGLNAEDYYLFNADYFDSLKELVKSNGWLYVAERDGQWIAAAIFLKGKRLLHYHLSASDLEHRIPGSTNILISYAAKKGRQAGFLRLHLGGGKTTSPEDSLFIFKRKMATDVHSFYIGKRIHDFSMYKILCGIWREKYPQLSNVHGNKLLCYRYSNYA